MTPTATRFTALSVAVAAAVAIALPAGAQDDVLIATTKIGDRVAMLEGKGGNLAACYGDDGILLVDAQFPDMSEKIAAALKELADKPLKIVVNTHWHGDHVGGNENFAKMGSVIVAHANVRERMSTEQFIEIFQRKVLPTRGVALPSVTFQESITFHMNGEEIHVVHVPPAHTDTDSFVHFKTSNVLHMGDTYFQGRYAFLTPSSGGSIDGMIGAADIALKMANDETKIIPGHGDLSNKKELKEYRDMLQTVRDRVVKLKDDGKTLEEVIAAKPTADLDEKWAGPFPPVPMFLTLVYKSLPEPK